ncbi:MAG TPA: methylase, partial [Bacteroidota bacterium]|nr:methylase [Bacteroidota bacterium]
ASEVFEHIFNPLEFLSELNRVVKINGFVLMTVPFLWPEHMQPLDFGRYSSFGLRALLEQHGFEILHQRKSMTGIRAIIQLWNIFLYRKTETRSGVLNFLFCVVLIAPWNLLGEILSFLLPDNEEIYLDTIILARKIKNL